MEIFPALGLAVLGIFATISLSGILAGVIAFGWIDTNARRRTQERVISELIDEPVRRYFSRVRNLSSVESRDDEYLNFPLWEHAALRALEEHSRFRSATAAIVRLAPANLFSLQYRQLCGQIAHTVGSEFYDHDFSEDLSRPYEFNALGPMTLSLLIADASIDDEPMEPTLRLHQSDAKTRALRYLDAVQIALAKSIIGKVRLYAMLIITVILTAILIPNFDALNLFATSSSMFARGWGTVIAMAIAPILIIAFAFAATVVSVLTFRLIDQNASSR